MKPIIFNYDNYRAYLNDMYAHLKQSKSGFSHRYFARRAGFATSNFLKLVCDGKRNLSSRSIPKFVKGLGLNKQEAEFFDALVHFNLAKTTDEKNRHFGKMAQCRRFRQLRCLEKEQFRFYSHWYYSAIRELVNLPQFREDPVWIASILSPAITVRQAQEGLELLLQLELLERDDNNRLRQRDATLTSGDEVKSLAVTNFHKEMLLRAADALTAVESHQRDMSAVTFGVPEGKIAHFKAKIQNFRKELLASLANHKEPMGRVYQLNMQLFPLSRALKRQK